MKNLIGFLFILAVILTSCSKKQETLEVGTHPADWNNPQSVQFHGVVVTETGPANCQIMKVEPVIFPVSPVMPAFPIRRDFCSPVLPIIMQSTLKM
jgi:hypothetical protein